MRFAVPTGRSEEPHPSSHVGPGAAHTLLFLSSRPSPILEVCVLSRPSPARGGWVPSQRTPTCLTHELLLVVESAVFLTGLHSYIDFLSFLQ